MLMKTLLAQGAEAKIYKFSIENEICVLKERISKTYRIKELDEKIRKYRTRREINILEKASKIIPVPKLNPASSEKDFTIVMAYIDGKKLTDCLDDFTDEKRIRICKEIGKNTALLHNNNIIHGDLTTSNIMLRDNIVYFIDFGLGFIDNKIEHKAVDLHLLKQALESKHYKHFESSFHTVLEGYKENSRDYDKVINRLNKVEKRGRYKNRKK